MATRQKRLTRLEALAILADCDHGFLSPDGARELAKPFGLEPKLYKERANTGEFKGLEVPRVGAGELVEGMAAHVLAEAICRHLHLGTGADIGIEGKGSRLRFAVERIRAHLEK